MKIKHNALAVAITMATALTLSACGGSSSGGGGGGTLKMTGGLGGANGGSGGDGGDFYAELSSGGDILLGTGPAPDTRFTPTNLNKIATELGENPLIVTTDMTLAHVAAFANKPPAGTYYLSGAGGGNYNIRKSDGDLAAFNAAEVVSGLEIARGATLTVSPNDGSNEALFYLDHDVIVKGTLATAEYDATRVASLDISAASVLIHRGGVITTAGIQPGQRAGSIYIYPDYSFINQGKVLSYGADNDTGDAGRGRTQYIDADFYFENTGLLDAHGGSSKVGEGGGAGYINSYANLGDFVNSGDIFAHGGFGELGGGDGNDVYLKTYNYGDVKVSGTITFYGGDAGAGVGANGGDADYVEFHSFGGGIYSTANLKGWGGSSQSINGDGGEGGYIEFYNREDKISGEAPPLGVNVAGSIDISGGNVLASGSGNGGDVDSDGISIDVADQPNGRQNVVFHFNKIDMSGGHGNYGGDAGNLELYNNDNYSNALDVAFPSGTIDMRWTTVMNGGDVVKAAISNGSGGDGGDLYITSDTYAASASAKSGLVKISGNIEMSGGESMNTASTSNATSGEGYIWGYNGVSFANITARGGNDRAPGSGINGYGGYSSQLAILSPLGDVIGGRIDLSGGNGKYRGGQAGGLEAVGHTMRFALVANGGNANPALGGSTGGDVDDVYIWSQQGTPGVSGVSVTRKAGIGQTAGDDRNYSMVLGSTCTGLGC